jgi:elongation factor Ts
MHDTLGSARSIEIIPIDSLLNAPLMPHPSQTELNHNDIGKTVSESIVETIGKLGENISLRRAAIVTNGVSASYIHGGDAASGKMGGLAVLQPKKVTLAELDPTSTANLAKTARQVARQVVGFNPIYLNTTDVPETELAVQTNLEEFEETNVLNKQHYLLKPEFTIAQYVEQAADAEVIDFIRWEVGEGIEKKENDFADEVNQVVNGN